MDFQRVMFLEHEWNTGHKTLVKCFENSAASEMHKFILKDFARRFLQVFLQ